MQEKKEKENFLSNSKDLCFKYLKVSDSCFS